MVLVFVGLILGMVAVNRFGFFENERMKRQLEIQLRARGEFPKSNPIFVGFARPDFSSMIDPHEDVGFLVLRANNIVFVSETKTLDLEKSTVKSVRFRPNVHSVFGLGRWISIETTTEAGPSRWLIEPREKRTLRQNLRFGRSLKSDIEKWIKA